MNSISQGLLQIFHANGKDVGQEWGIEYVNIRLVEYSTFMLIIDVGFELLDQFAWKLNILLVEYSANLHTCRSDFM